MTVLIFDTETTGLPEKNKHEDLQPHVVQLACTLVDNNERIVSQLNHIIKPEGWDIPKDSIDVHGITMEMATKYGLSRQAVLIMFANLVKKADILVAHNAQFDLKILNLQYKRQGTQSPLIGKEIYCTAANSVNIMKLPPTERMKQYGYGQSFKTPNLQELHVHLFSWWDGARAHDAMGDVDACMRCYYKLKIMETSNEVANI